jgi:hypothetical protein
VNKLPVIATNENGAVLNIAVASCCGLAIWFFFGQNDPSKEENKNNNRSSILGTAPVGFEVCQNFEGY